ncbi:MAG: D-alanyl-D-alanine carboxypeptidase/D-alanyl-D-alanine-endopeptidase [Ignavibacteriae bacterium]|nr:D-alanyl-D-alanine carboxypeptidase/D-alanyl-D-alanine-endopeptidase [Ignavibacteriota bacterium]
MSKTDSTTTLARQIDSIVKDSVLAPVFIGIQVMSVENEKILYDLNSQKLFHPASNMKLLTTAAGLHALGTTFQFKTHLLTDGNVTNGILRGNLYIKAYGDPLIRTDDFDSLAEQLSARGIQTIAGNMIGDVRYFDTLSWGKGWMWDDEPEADEAFISPLTVNDNAIAIELHSGDRVGAPAVVTLNPPTSFVDIRNTSVTSYDTLIPPLTVTRRHGENIIRINGRVTPGSPNQKFTLSISQPERYFLHLLKERLALRGITMEGLSRIDSVHGTTLLAGIYHSIDSVLHQINKPSDNIAAENMLKTIASERVSLPGTAISGLTFLKEYLNGLGIDTSMMNVVDGSGVSWYNMISPAAMVRLLEEQYKSHDTFSHFYESLPVAGMDGTLRNRMHGTSAEKNVHGKTGSLTGESCISGYVTTVDGKLLAFCIFCNHSPGELSNLRSIQDRILELLANYNTMRP